MKNKIKRALKVLREEGIIVFVNKIIIYLINFIMKFSGFEKKYLFINKNHIISRLKNFKSDNTEKTFSFINNSFFSIFSTMQIKEEFLQLLDLFIEAKPKVIMEIGTARGGTLFCLSKLASSDATIISLDLPDGKFGGGYQKLKIPFYEAFTKDEQKLSLLREDSHRQESLEKVKEILNGRQIDFLFIDGDHSYDGIKKDFEMYSPLVRKGGIIAFHDIAPNSLLELTGGVPKFWKEIENQYQTKTFINDINQTGYGIGIIFL